MEAFLGISHARTGPTRFSRHLSTQSSRRTPWLTVLTCWGCYLAQAALPEYYNVTPVIPSARRLRAFG